MIKWLKFGFLIILLMVVVSSCSIERKLAMEFIRHNIKKEAVLISYPHALEMYNSNEYSLDSLRIPENFPLDSLLFQQTKVLSKLSDSVFLEKYMNSFIGQLQKLGYPIFLASDLDAFLKFQGPKYVFKFAQVELEEDYFPYPVEEEIDGTAFSKIFELNRIRMHNWFEFEALDTIWKKVFYSKQEVLDGFEAQFYEEQANGKPVLYFSIDSLAVDDVYRMAADVGYQQAQFLSDYLMNSYIDKHYTEGQSPKKYFQYFYELKMLFPFEDGFQEITK